MMGVSERNQPYLYVSFSEKNEKKVEEILARMQKDAFRLWYKSGKRDGNRKEDDDIAARIESCEMLLAFVSEEYLASQDCTDELNYARDLQKSCVLVYLDDARLPSGMRMRLSRLQALFYSHYEKSDDFYRQLYQAEGILACRVQNRAEIETSGGKENSPGGFGKKFTKKACVIVLVCVLAVIGVIGGRKGMRLNQQKQEEEEKSMVTLAFYPNEEMSVDEYAVETERLKGAFEALCGENAVFTSDEGSVRVTFPKSTFGEEDTWEDNMNLAMHAYIVAPIWVRLCGQSDIEDALWVHAEEMESVEVKNGTIPGASESDLATYGIEGEKYDYIEISLSDSEAERVLSCLSDWNEEAMVYVPYYYSSGYGTIVALAKISEDGKTMYLTFGDYGLSENITELIAYKIEHSDYSDEYTEDINKFLEPFTYCYDIPVDTWETVSGDGDSFLNQCNEEELADDAVIVRLHGYFSEESGEGTRQDEIDALKSRLETLGQPYAVGTVEGCDDLVIKTDAAHLGTGILELLTYGYSIRLGSYLYGVGMVEAENLSVEELADGTYGIVISYEADSTEAQALKEASKALADEGGGKIWLSLSASNGVGTRLAAASVTETITDGRLVLDELTLLGEDSITEENVWVADLFSAVLSEDVSAWSFYHDESSLQVGSVREGTYQEAELVIRSDSSEQEEIQTLLEDETGVTVDTDDWPDATITITLSDGQQPGDALEKLKEIYERCEFDTGKCGTLTISLEDSGGNAYAALWFKADDENRHCMVASGSLYGGSYPEYAQQLQQMLSTDEFFTTRAEIHADGTETWEITDD